MIATPACRLLRVALLCLATMALAAMWSCDRGGDASSAGTETNRGDAASESRSGEGSNGSGSSTTTDPDAISAADTQLGHLQQRFLQMQQRGEALGPLRVRVERFVSEHPEHPDARMLLAQVYLQQGDAEAASESLERAIELRPEVPAWRDMAATLAMQRGEYNTAERHLRAAIDMQPSDAMLRVRLAQVCLATDRLEQAENLLHAVLDLDASRHEAHHLLAAVARQRGRFVDARTHSRRAIELVRGEDALDVLRSIEPVEQRAHREVLELQAQCHADLGRPEAAANVYEQLLIVQPGHRAFAEKAFRWRLQAGQIDRARELLRYARRNFPASETTRAMAAAM
ncbi:MAG: tetratricopeptide repeat protein, partial [Phycisphaeraceae bacterium]